MSAGVVATRPRGRGKARASLELIDAAREILREIQPASVRAVCYRLFIARLIPDMSKGSTDRVGKQLVYAREQRIIPWAWIVDGTREIERPNTWSSPAELIESAADQYRLDWWEQQRVRVLLCSEKSTVAGTVRPVTDEYGVGFLSLHGYSSATVARDIAVMSTRSLRRPLLLIYIGDWDPSGMHMSEVDLGDRIARYGGIVSITRVALTADDVADPRLPGFPASDKQKDARYSWFVERYGHRCWELDAMSPVVLRERITAKIESLIDRDAWERCERVERVQRDSLLEYAASYQEVG
jgi:hypothetical protein